jgi:hypothetical protein
MKIARPFKRSHPCRIEKTDSNLNVFEINLRFLVRGENGEPNISSSDFTHFVLFL